jgi:hypothetical protein
MEEQSQSTNLFASLIALNKLLASGSSKIDFAEAPETPKLNKAVQLLGTNLILTYVETVLRQVCLNKYDPIVSIGSGNGHIERLLEHEIGLDIICVDPVKVSHENEVLYKTSQYDGVDELLSSRPELKSNCVTFINWSTPNDSTYDYEAVKALDSEHILIIFESTGSGGGSLLHKWLRFCGVVTDQEFTPEDVDMHSFPKYSVVKSTVSRINTPLHGMFEYEIVWLSRSPSSITVDISTIPEMVGENIPRKKYDPMESMLETMFFGLSGMAKSCGMSDYMDNIQNDIAKNRQERELQKQESLLWGGYQKPDNPLSDSDLLLWNATIHFIEKLYVITQNFLAI